MSAMGKGYWLDPDNRAMYLVADFQNRHEFWLLDAKNQEKTHLPSAVTKTLNSMGEKLRAGDARMVDAIRLEGIKAGLIRIRDYYNYISIMLSAPRSRVRDVLWSVYMAMDNTMKPHENAELLIVNMNGNDSTKITWGDFQKSLVDDSPILREDEKEGGLSEQLDKIMGKPA